MSEAASIRIGAVRTVLGDVPADALGAVDYHEHLFQCSPLLPGDELDDPERSGDEAAMLRAAGIDAMIEATPVGLGRNPREVARISASTGLAVVHTTGAHHQGHYRPDDPILALDATRLTARFVAEVELGFTDPQAPDDGPVTTGPHGTPVRAGIVKAGVRYWAISTFEQAALEAAAHTSASTGVALMVHLDHGSAAHEVLDRIEAAGTPAHRVVLAHMDRNLDPELHASLILRGAFLGYDGMARHREAPDAAVLRCLTDTVALAGSARIVLGGDVARSSRYRAYGGLPGLEYLPRRFLPRVEAALGREVLDDLMRANPAALLRLATP